MAAEATAPPRADGDKAGARLPSSRALSSGADRARESEGDGGAMRTRLFASRCPDRKLVRDSAVGDSKMALLPPSLAGFCRTNFLSPKDPQLDFLMAAAADYDDASHLSLISSWVCLCVTLFSRFLSSMNSVSYLFIAH